VNGVRHNCNLAVLPDRLLPNWTQATFETLSVADIELLAALDAEIVLLGTGNRLRFPVPNLLRPLAARAEGARSDGSAGRLPHLQRLDG
jgi:uncharacterized protein